MSTRLAGPEGASEARVAAGAARKRRAAIRQRPLPPTTEADRQFWIERLGLEDALALSRTIWPPASRS